MLPTLDLADADADLDAFRTALREAAHGYGFFYLTGHGVPRERCTEVLRLARQFFALPDAAKDEISQLKSPQFRGYSRLGGELTNGTVDWREQIDIGPERGVIADAGGYWRLQGPNLWPSALPALRPVFERWSAGLSGVGLRLLRHWAVSLGAAETVFDAAFADRPATLIKVVRYPGTVTPPRALGAHKDSGVLTLLWPEPDSQGLQVELRPGEWIDVAPVDGAFVVNTGELLEVADRGIPTRHSAPGDRPATRHRPGVHSVLPRIRPWTPGCPSSRCPQSWPHGPAESKPTRTIRSSTPTGRTPGSRARAPTPTSPNCTTGSAGRVRLRPIEACLISA